MGEAKRRRLAQSSGPSFSAADEKLRRLGVDVGALGFYNQPAFVAFEQEDPLALELYSDWVISRPRDAEYETHASQVVPKLAALVEQRLAAEQGLGACVNAATMMVSMLDRLGVWSFAVRGSLTVEIPGRADVEKRYFPEFDVGDDADSATGHGWLVAPPFLVVDATLRHQKWVALHPAIRDALPAFVAAQEGEIVRPRWDDVVSDTLVAMYHLGPADLNVRLPYQFKPDLARVEKSLPGRDVRVGPLSLRYIAGAVTVSDMSLEDMPWVSPASPNLRPIHIWNEDIAPAFGVTP
jgi:hypothetical protein